MVLKKLKKIKNIFKQLMVNNLKINFFMFIFYLQMKIN